MKRLIGSLVGLAVVVLLVLIPAGFAGGGSDATSGLDTARIDTYRAVFSVQPDGDLHATETLQVDYPVAKHGIYRFFDTVDAADPSARLVPENISVTRDGQADGLDISHKSGGRYVVARIGDPDVTMTGTHTYVIRYDIPGALGKSGSGSEFYWNLIPSGWQMSIGSARLTAILPAAPRGTPQCAIGNQTTSGCTASVSGRTVDVTTGALAPHTPVTIKTAVPVAFPGQRTLPWSWHLDPVLGRSVPVLLVVVLLALAALVGGFLLSRVAREEDPAFPLMYGPPEGIGPGEGAYLLTERVTDDMYAATILQLGEKGLATIQRDNDGWTVTGAKGDWSQADVLTQQTAGALGIHAEGDSFTAQKDDVAAGKKMLAARSGFKSAVTEWAQTNSLMVAKPAVRLGALLCLVGVVVLLVCCFVNPVEMSAVGLPFGFFAVAAAPLMLPGSDTIRTAEGRDLWSKVGGFKRVLGTPSSESRFDFSGRTELYTQYIPWAVAFGVADVWAEKYRVEMQAEPPAPAYFLGGYYGGAAGFAGNDFSSSFNSSVDSAISSYQATQSSSSGGGGGGFSGGGGGGGGGGGSW